MDLGISSLHYHVMQCVQIRTVFPRVTNDDRGLRAQPKVIDGLDFELIRSEGIGIVDVVLQPFGGGVLPLLSGISSPPPHQVLEVGPVPLSVGQRLKEWFAKNSIIWGKYQCIKCTR